MGGDFCDTGGGIRNLPPFITWIRRFILFHKKRHTREMGSSDVSAFLSWLATNRHVSASTQNQALSAVLFLYRAVLHQDVGPIEHVPRARVPGGFQSC